VATGELLHVIPAHDQWIRSLCTTKDGLHIATASWDHTIKLWKADTLNIEATLIGHTDMVISVVAAGMYVIHEKTFKIWGILLDTVKTRIEEKTLTFLL
jgi:WD40 repeat protein